MAETPRWWPLVLADLLLVGLGPFVANRIADDWPLQIVAGVVAILTFFVVWLNQETTGRNMSKNLPDALPPNPIRDAIAATFVVTYLAMMVWHVSSRSTSGQAQTALDALTQQFLSHFTYLTGVVVTFYFGAGAVERVAHIRSKPTTKPGEGLSPTPSTDVTAPGINHSS